MVAHTPSWWGSTPMRSQDVDRWVAKARCNALPLLELAGPVADPAEVAPGRVDDSAEWAFGNFMLAWLDADAMPRHVRHLPDGSFFLRLLGIVYEPVFRKRPDLAELLTDLSRPEMSLTNDVLQIQLAALPGYSMIRHHALMLFVAALWLEEPRRTQWLDLYDELVLYVDSQPQGRPDLAQLAAAEEGAFEDFVTLSPQTVEPTSAAALLDDRTALARVLDYQLYAGVAIGLLWRDYRTLSDDGRQDWLRDQLSVMYVRPDYLESNWTDLP